MHARIHLSMSTCRLTVCLQAPRLTQHTYLIGNYGFTGSPQLVLACTCTINHAPPHMQNRREPMANDLPPALNSLSPEHTGQPSSALRERIFFPARLTDLPTKSSVPAVKRGDAAAAKARPPASAPAATSGPPVSAPVAHFGANPASMPPKPSSMSLSAPETAARPLAEPCPEPHAAFGS